MSMLQIFVGNTTILELQELTNTVSGAAVTTATVTATIETSQGTDIGGQTFPLTLSHVSAGTYRGTIENDLAIVAGRTYDVTIDATVAGVGVGHWDAKIKAMERA